MINTKSVIGKLAEIIGIILYFLPIIGQIIVGQEFGDILFDKVIGIVDIALILRDFHLILFWGMWIAIILLISSTVLIKTDYSKEQRNYWLFVSTRIISGWILANWVIFLLINSVFYRGAVVTFPFLLGTLLLIITIIAIRFDKKLYQFIEETRSSNNKKEQIFSLKATLLLRYVVFIILALIMILPNQAPLMGFYAEPPGLPPVYGGESGPYDVVKYRIEHSLPGNISQYLLPDNDNNTWYIFLYLPLTDNTEIPLTFYAHGYTGTDPTNYENSLYQLATRGSAVIFTQYVTDVELGGEFAESEETNFTSSNAMYFRYLMEWNGINQAVNLLQSGENSDITAILQGSTINTDYIQIIGHSVGGGMVPYLATRTVEQGWGTDQLILDLETPWFASEHPLTRYNLSILPETTMINIVGTQDDHTASPCIGMIHFENFYKELGQTNLAYIIIPSDFYGFPRLIATHYVVTSALDDTLTKWGYMKRVDAMVAYLVELANGGDIGGIDQYFLDGNSTMTSQGIWSDGTPVNSLIHSLDPYGIRGGENIAENYVQSHDVGPEICRI